MKLSVKRNTTAAEMIDYSPELSKLSPWFIGVWVIAMFACLIGGPHLSDHEVIVAQTARQILGTGHWVVPEYLDTPFLVKPPLSPWIVAMVSKYLPPAKETGLPVTDESARLPSVVAMMLTVWIVWRLALSMFERRAALISATACATCVGTLLYALNATAEAILTLFCTWAFAEFWWAHRALNTGQRRLHLVRFYLALGLSMMAKGPMPAGVVIIPLAAWWWGQQSTRIVAAGGIRSVGRGVRRAIREAWPRLRWACTRLGMWWGVPIFAIVFVPWMFAVARQEPYAWSLWNYEFLDRAKGNYPGCHWGEFYYYLPIIFGMIMPWGLSLPEALASPFLKPYRKHRATLTYAWYWVVMTLLFTSVMSFKKPYYILPAIPGCALLLGPVLDRFFFDTVIVSRKRAGWALAAILGGFSIVPIVGFLTLARMYPEEWLGRAVWLGPVIAVLGIGGLLAAGVFFVRGARASSFRLIGGSSLAVFSAAWIALGPAVGNIEDPMAVVAGLRESKISPDVSLHWASNRPDGRVVFYGAQKVEQVVDPYHLIASRGPQDTNDDLREKAAYRICDLLEGNLPVYVLLQREDFETLMFFLRPTAHELFSIDRGNIGKDKDDWVVVTNRGA